MSASTGGAPTKRKRRRTEASERVVEGLRERNKRVGHVLRLAREKMYDRYKGTKGNKGDRTDKELQKSCRDYSQEACARLLGTSRRRYSLIENGEVGITVAELELLSAHLRLSTEELFPSGEVGGWGHIKPHIIEVAPDETVSILVKVAEVDLASIDPKLLTNALRRQRARKPEEPSGKKKKRG